VFCVWCWCVCVVLYIVFSYALFSYLHITSFQFLPVNQRMYLCDTFRLIAVCPNHYLFPSPHHQLPSSLWQSALMLCLVGGVGGAVVGMWERVVSVKMVSKRGFIVVSHV
jgi:hypothetical protein